MQDVIDELRLYVTGWLNYFGISHSYKAVLELGDWVRRRVRLYYWKQWKQPRTRRRHLIALGANPNEVKMATRSRKGYWRMSSNRIVQQALNNRWLEEPGSSRHAHIVEPTSLRAKSPSLIGTAGCGPACPVVWDPWLTNT